MWHKLCLSRIITLLSNSCFDSSDRMLDSCFGQNVWVRITGSEITLARQIPIISLFVESYVHKALSCAYSPSLRTGITLALKISNALLEHQLEAIMWKAIPRWLAVICGCFQVIFQFYLRELKEIRSDKIQKWIFSLFSALYIPFKILELRTLGYIQ